MHAFIISVFLYMFPPQVVAKLIIILFDRLAKCTKWTTIDDEFSKVVKDKIGEDDAK